jgi:small redox-active disulfide protein 2
MRIEILGSGCARCHGLEDSVRKALATLGKDAEVVDVTDMQQIMAYGVMSMPALVIDGKVMSAGRVLTPEEAKKAIIGASA